MPLVIFRESESHGTGGREAWFEGLASSFYVVLSAVRLLDGYVEMCFGNIFHSLSRVVNLVAFQFLGVEFRSEYVGDGVPVA